MMAVDTNIVVRLLMRDDESQWERAVALFKQHEILIVPSVLLETEWVLRGLYRLERSWIREGFEKLLGSERVLIDAAAAVRDALDDYTAGLDFADALHVRHAQVCGARSFATFDARLRRRAGRRVTSLDMVAP